MLFQKTKDKIADFDQDQDQAPKAGEPRERVLIDRFDDDLSETDRNVATAAWPEQEEMKILRNSDAETGDFSMGDSPEADWDESEEGEEESVEALNAYSLRDEMEITREPVEKRTPVAVSNLGISIAEDLTNRFGRNIKSALGPGTVIEGKFSFDSPVCIDGTLSGDVKSSSVLIVGEEATVTGSIEVGSLIVLGTVSGDVEAEELVEVRSGGMLEADIQTKRICLQDGAWFSGRITME